MHVLPLPFGLRLAVAVLHRRDAELLRGPAAPVTLPAAETYDPATARTRVLCDLRYADQRLHVI
jgi:hypothetical protein